MPARCFRQAESSRLPISLSTGPAVDAGQAGGAFAEMPMTAAGLLSFHYYISRQVDDGRPSPHGRFRLPLPLVDYIIASRRRAQSSLRRRLAAMPQFRQFHFCAPRYYDRRL